MKIFLQNKLDCDNSIKWFKSYLNERKSTEIIEHDIKIVMDQSKFRIFFTGKIKLSKIVSWNEEETVAVSGTVCNGKSELINHKKDNYYYRIFEWEEYI